jgi:hypothetical protein
VSSSYRPIARVQRVRIPAARTDAARRRPASAQIVVIAPPRSHILPPVVAPRVPRSRRAGAGGLIKNGSNGQHAELLRRRSAVSIYRTVADIIAAQSRLIAKFGGSIGIRERGALDLRPPPRNRQPVSITT